MTITLDPVVPIECRKIWRAAGSRIAALAVLALVSATSIGGYAAAVHRPGSDLGRKAAAMIAGPGWDGYVGLTALSLGVTVLLSTGIVVARMVGREFTDGTVVGLFAIPTSRSSVALAKISACLCWGVALVLAQSTVSALGGVALGLPLAGALGCWLTLVATGLSVVVSAVPVAWVATRWRGYLPGIGATPRRRRGHQSRGRVRARPVPALGRPRPLGDPRLGYLGPCVVRPSRRRPSRSVGDP
ncbi:ABC-2 type transport system permease protein [Kineosphaera limosa]|uniref:ABC transporter permease protein n=1 Tax=Kineosphaera limosa NBRC 100340 TaxID=1184609 RepID=K6WUB3_9MICO|nr:ABC transporter permease [Kineosphaera limosa]NYE02571.1 ABC-2 type transport system permease protein [Kineosphaera limosa]GAB97416.1 hypothetical protein KILIM_067_00170 [Kineosphaera limosa NBRC 100340]